MTRMASALNSWQPIPWHEDVDETSPLLGHELKTHDISERQHHDIPIDCGVNAWLQVLGGWILFANSWGLANSYGAFQSFYSNTLLPEDASSIAWIGSIQLFFTTFGCLPGGVFLDRGYLKSLIAIGTALEIVGLLWTACSKSYWQILLAHGVCVGVGSGILGLIPVAVIAKCFEEKRMVATGLAATGASFAGIIYPITLRVLFDTLGFSGTLCIFALIILISNTIPFMIMRLKEIEVTEEASFGLHHFKDLAFTSFVWSFTLLMASAFVPYFFIQEYAMKLGIPENVASLLLVVMNAANLFGRFVPNFIADRYGGINTLIPLSLSCIIVLIIIPLAHTLHSLIIVTILYGFLSGGVLIISAPIIADLSPNHAEMGIRMGLAYLVAAFGGLVGNPIAGAVVAEGDDAVMNFQWAWWSAAGIMGLAVAAMLITRSLKLGNFLGHGKV